MTAHKFVSLLEPSPSEELRRMVEKPAPAEKWCKAFGYIEPPKTPAPRIFEEPFWFYPKIECSFCAAVWAWLLGRK